MVITPVWEEMGHVRKHYIELKSLPSLDLKLSTVSM